MMEEIAALIRQEGWTQAEAAARLRISQGYLSKLLKGSCYPSPRLEKRMRELLAGPRRPNAEWLAGVERAAQASPDFRDLVEAALHLMHNYSQ